MTFKYTTPKKIARRLGGKLRIVDENANTPWKQSLEVQWVNPDDDDQANAVDPNKYLNYSDVPGSENISELTSQVVEMDLLEDVVSEKEEYIDLILGQIYELPFNHHHKIVEQIVTYLVVSDLINIKYSVLNEGTELEKRYLQQAHSYLNMLIAGYDIETPFSQNQNPSSPRSYPTRISLPGETLRRDTPQESYKNFYFNIEKWEDESDSYDRFFLDNQ